MISIFDCDGNGGCCRSTIYRPKEQYCSIDCTGGCNHVTIHAQCLFIKNCNEENGDNWCGNMKIFCPRDRRGDNA